MKTTIICIALMLCSCLVSCRPRPKAITIVYVVPAGFRGAVVVCQDQSGIEDVSWSGKMAVINISSNGVAHTRSTLPSRQWHSKRARYADGTELPVESSAGVPDSAVVLRRVGGRANEFEKEWLVVGDRQDLRQAIEKIDGFKWPP